MVIFVKFAVLVDPLSYQTTRRKDEGTKNFTKMAKITRIAKNRKFRKMCIVAVCHSPSFHVLLAHADGNNFSARQPANLVPGSLGWAIQDGGDSDHVTQRVPGSLVGVAAILDRPTQRPCKRGWTTSSL